MQTRTVTTTTEHMSAIPVQNRAVHHPENDPENHRENHPGAAAGPPARAPEVVMSAAEAVMEEAEHAPEPREARSRTDSGGPTSDLFRQYLREIGRIPLLNAADEVELARRVEAGLFAEERLANTPDPDSRLAVDLDRLVVMGRTAKRRLIEAN
ncbi:RNA polymerase subunit sigma-70, partial [Streptomyces sp. SID8455]|nr:RNA polymerase subunit sigma-70 [Streptomyces sp. SID8455]